MTSFKRVHVAVAVIHQPQALVDCGSPKILITKRANHVHQGGLWEFPGGKVDEGETVRQALCRELQEELGITVVDDGSANSSISPLICIPFDYPDKQVLLDVWNIHAYEGVPRGCEGQPLAWVSQSDLSSYSFPAANQPIIDACVLPSRYLITPEFASLELAKTYVEQALDCGFELIQLRQHQLSDAEYRTWADALFSQYSGRCVRFVWNRCLDLLQSLPAGGWHLSAKSARDIAAHIRNGSVQKPELMGVSCHNAEELELAQSIDANYALLSPVQYTKTHPNADVLGFDAFERLVQKAQLPVYALGGMNEGHLQKVQSIGAQGVAAINAWKKIILKEAQSHE